ncbi:DUF4245 domain-containing protein [Aeromicrobium terrae]|uniref:DUF4245 domain-containing protein n=2 Tax=Aeromicrobium terrae TaxID=2498846 RepID=A0A5C8NK71_9ACTN|nr:DUF4245 domain-containing protein [Aeromicrobium terrae]
MHSTISASAEKYGQERRMSGTSSRGNPALGDILRSVAVIGAILLGVYGIAQIMTVEPEHPTSTVDYQSALDSARPVADFDLLGPTSLPKGWRATSARYESDSWHLGVITDDDEYVGLEQLRASAQETIRKFAEDSRPAGSVTIDGTSWQRRTEPDGDSTYVRRDGDMTVLVTGSAKRAEIERYVSSLSSSS